MEEMQFLLGTLLGTQAALALPRMQLTLGGPSWGLWSTTAACPS